MPRRGADPRNPGITICDAPRYFAALRLQASPRAIESLSKSETRRPLEARSSTRLVAHRSTMTHRRDADHAPHE